MTRLPARKSASCLATRTGGAARLLGAIASDLTGRDLSELFAACAALNVRLRAAAFWLDGRDDDEPVSVTLLPVDRERAVGVLSDGVELVLTVGDRWPRRRPGSSPRR